MGRAILTRVRPPLSQRGAISAERSRSPAAIRWHSIAEAIPAHDRAMLRNVLSHRSPPDSAQRPPFCRTGWVSKCWSALRFVPTGTFVTGVVKLFPRVRLK